MLRHLPSLAIPSLPHPALLSQLLASLSLPRKVLETFIAPLPSPPAAYPSWQLAPVLTHQSQQTLGFLDTKSVSVYWLVHPDTQQGSCSQYLLHEHLKSGQREGPAFIYMEKTQCILLRMGDILQIEMCCIYSYMHNLCTELSSMFNYTRILISFSSLLLVTIFLFVMCISWNAMRHMCKVAAQLEGVTSLLPPRRFQELNSNCQAWQQAPWLTEPSHWTLFLTFIILSYVLDFLQSKFSIKRKKSKKQPKAPKEMKLLEF